MSAGKRSPGAPNDASLAGTGGVVIAGDSWGDPNGPLVLHTWRRQTRHAWKNAGPLGGAGYHPCVRCARHGDSSWAADGNYAQARCR